MYTGNPKIVLVLDQHSAHSGVASGVRNYLKNHFDVFFLPSSTCWLNSAEFLIAYVKERLKQYFLTIEQEVIGRDEFIQRVRQ